MDTQTKAQHTPGPWATKPENDYITAQIFGDGQILADVFGGSREIRKANARLIAAAPELLEALQDVREQAYRVDRNGDVGLPLGAWEHVLAAIAKAEGKQA